MRAEAPHPLQSREQGYRAKIHERTICMRPNIRAEVDAKAVAIRRLIDALEKQIGALVQKRIDLLQTLRCERVRID